MQVSVERSARACYTRVSGSTAEEGFDEDEAGLEKGRTEGYLSGSPEGDTRGFRDPLRSEEPIPPCLTSSSSPLALPAPSALAPPPLPPPPEHPAEVEGVSQEGNRKRKAEEQGVEDETAEEAAHAPEVILLPAHPVRPLISPSRVSSPLLQSGSVRRSRPLRSSRFPAAVL